MAGVDTYTKVLCHADGVDASTSFTDDSSYSHTLTGSGAEVDTAFKVFGTGSAYWNGSGGAISSPSSANFDITTNDFCIDARIRFESFGAPKTHTILSRYLSSTINWSFEYDTTSGLGFQYINSTQIVSQYQSWSPSLDTWYHVAVVRSGSNYYFYVDGTYLGTGSDADSIALTSGGIQIGQNGAAATFFDGWIDELRFSVGSDRINQSDDPLYISSGTPSDGFTPPAEAYSPPIYYADFPSRALSIQTVESEFPARASSEAPNWPQAQFPARIVAATPNWPQALLPARADAVAYANSTLPSRADSRAYTFSDLPSRNTVIQYSFASLPSRSGAQITAGWEIWTLDKDTEVWTYQGFIAATDSPKTLADVSLADGDYDVEARPVLNYWEGTTGGIRTPLSITAGSPVVGLPDIVDFAGTNSLGWTRLTWKVSAQPSTACTFGIWRGASSPVDTTTDPAEATVLYDEDVQEYYALVRQTSDSFFAVKAYTSLATGPQSEVEVLITPSGLTAPTGVHVE